MRQGLGLVLALLLTCCLTLGRLLPVSEPQSPHLTMSKRRLNVPKSPFPLSSMLPSSSRPSSLSFLPSCSQLCGEQRALA